jgi:drug/metabolite transporter (DMT)-like permease
VTLLSGVAALAVLFLGLPMTPGVIRASDLGWASAAGACGGVGAMLIYRAMALGPVSVASPVLCVVGLALPVLVGVALGERPTPLAVAGLALAPAAIVLLAQTGFGLTADERARVRRVLGPAVAAGLAAGGFLVFFGRVQAGAGLWPLILARALGMAVLAVGILASRKAFVPPRAVWTIALGAGALDSLANVCYVAGVQRGSMALVAALVSLSPATAVLLARFVLRERMSRPQQAGFALALVAGALIATG